MGMRLQVFLLLLVAAAWSQSRGGRLTARDTTIYRKPVSLAADSDQIPGTLGTQTVDRKSGVVSIQRLDRKVPRPAQKEYDRALKDVKKSSSESAMGHLRNAIALYPDYMEAHNELGVCMVAEKQADKAVAEFQRATELDPGSAGAAYNLSLALFSLQRYPEAEAALRLSLRLNPALEQTRYLLGLSLYEQHQEGEETLEDLKRVTDQYPEAHVPIARILADKGRNAEAVAELKQYLATPDGAADRHVIETWLTDLELQASTNHGPEARMPY
jgi:tetratricopeptide (TPR) repeat protein